MTRDIEQVTRHMYLSKYSIVQCEVRIGQELLKKNCTVWRIIVELGEYRIMIPVPVLGTAKFLVPYLTVPTKY
jgi:hypothetical protein